MLATMPEPRRPGRVPLCRAAAAATIAALIVHGGLMDRAVAGGCGACDDDQDGLSNALEVAYGTQLTTADSDGDGLSDADEPAIYTTSADEFDTDGDGRNDWAEIFIDGTNPRVGDTDGDGYGDFAEGVKGTNPLDPTDYPTP